MDIYKSVGLKNLNLVINSLGDKESRLEHREALINHFKPRIGEFCKDCQSRLEKNPLRILDCKVDREHELMETAPSILDYLNDDSKEYFAKVQQYLDALGIEYTVDSTLVRGLDYYNQTTFEIMSSAPGFGAITTLCGGGRYNGLVEEFGGPETPGIGFALSIERLIAAMEAENVQVDFDDQLDFYIVALGDAAKDYSVKLLADLRNNGFTADRDYQDRKMKAQMKSANRLNANYVVIIGEDELEKGEVQVKNMQSGEQEEVKLSEFIDVVKQWFN